LVLLALIIIVKLVDKIQTLARPHHHLFNQVFKILFLSYLLLLICQKICYSFIHYLSYY